MVRIVGIEPGLLRVAGVDAVDGTPVYDVKPYLPWSESIPSATSDWAPEPPSAAEDESVIIPAEIIAQLGTPTTLLVRKLLRLELHPAYHDADSRVYGMTVAGWNVRWRATGRGGVEVCEVAKASSTTVR